MFLHIKKLKERGHHVYLASIAEYGVGKKNIEELRKFTTEMEFVSAKIYLSKFKFLGKKSLLQEIFSYQPGFEAKIRSLIGSNNIDVAIYEGLGAAQYRAAAMNIPSILYEHNVEYEIIEQLVSSVRQSPLKILEGNLNDKLLNLWLRLFGEREKKMSREFELNSLKKFDLIVTCSERDASILKQHIENAPHTTIPWCVEIPLECSTPKKKDIFNLVFVGSMYYEPNRDAILWFARDIFPSVRERLRNIRFVIVGSYSSEIIRGLDNGKDVIVRGFVPDLSSVWLDTDVFIAPIRRGSGVNVKVIEAMAYGIPVITTSKGAEGLNAIAGEHFLIANMPDEFSDNIQNLIEKPEWRMSLGLKARQYISEHHEINEVMDLFEEVLRDVISKWKQEHS